MLLEISGVLKSDELALVRALLAGARFVDGRLSAGTAARRELLYGLGAAREKLLQNAPEAEESAQVSAAYLNLIRMWSEI